MLCVLYKTNSYCMYTTVKRFGVSKICLCLWKVTCAHQDCIYLIKNPVKTVMFWNIITIENICFLFEYILKCNLFMRCIAEFSASLLQSSVSRDPSEIILICWFGAQQTFIVIISIIHFEKFKNKFVLLNIFVEIFICFLWIERSK